MSVPVEPDRGHDHRAGDRLQVVVAFPLGDAALASLGDRAGPAVEVRDIRRPGPDPHVVLCPPSSPQLISQVRRQYPQAAVIVVELEDWLQSIHVQGPIGRVLDAGAATYFVAPSTEALGGFLTELGSGHRPVIAGLAGPGRQVGGGEMRPALAEPVQQVVTRYLDAIDAARSGLIEGLYLIGSVALDDYRPRTSDVDFIAVAARPADDEAAALRAARARVADEAGLPPFEGIYVTYDQLRASPSASSPGLFHHDGKLQSGPNMRGPVEWATLARHGLVLRGRAPADIGVHDDPDQLVAWTLGNLESYWTPWVERARDHSTQTAMALLTDWGVAWGVLGVSRLHYTLATGQITSKTGAGRHALDAFSEEWHPIITEALRCRPMPLAFPDAVDEAAARRDEAADFMAAAIAAGRALG
ncbi:MAG TPA: aminoglycoside adenylyltransferase domain-containing protein [Acidimicrobiales bacterium]|nr:aminoglycoside adenylyltransferase domain-containing protein [Acidimicrobiales bacterium]